MNSHAYEEGPEQEEEEEEEKEEEEEEEEEDVIAELSARIASSHPTGPSKRHQLSSLYNQHKHRLHALLPKTSPASFHSPSSQHQTTVPSPIQPESNTHPLSPEPFDSTSLINKHFSPSFLPVITTAAFPSSSATEPIVPDAQLEDGPLLRAQLSGLEHRASQLRKSIKPLIKIFEQIHANLCAGLELDARLHQALEILDETTPACYRPLREIYNKSAKMQGKTIDEERKEHLEHKVLDPLRRMSSNLKEASQQKKAFTQQAKLYDEALQKYLAIKSDGESEVRKMAQMKAKAEFARVEYHHWIYDQAVFREAEVLDLLTEYVVVEHACRRLPSPETDTIGSELINLKQELAIRRIEREMKQRDMLNHRQAWKSKLNGFLITSAGADSTSHPRSASSTPGNAKPLVRSLSGSDSSHAGPSFIRPHELGEKLRGLAMTLSGKTLGGEEGGLATSRGHINLTIPESLPMTVSDSAESDTLEELSFERVSTSMQRKKEGFLLSCTKAMVVGGPQRSPKPAERVQGTGGIPSGDAVRSWKKLWCVLDGGELREYKGDGLVEPHRPGIDLRYAMVRPRKGKVERKFSFEVVTTQFVRVYQAFSFLEMTKWVAAIEASIESLLQSSSSAKTTRQKLRDEQPRLPPLNLSIDNKDNPGGWAGDTGLTSSPINRKQGANTLCDQKGTLQVEWRPCEDPVRNTSFRNSMSRTQLQYASQLWKSFTSEDDYPVDQPRGPHLRSRSAMLEEDLQPVTPCTRPDDQSRIQDDIIEEEEDGSEGRYMRNEREEDEDEQARHQEAQGADRQDEEELEAIHERNWYYLDALSERSTCAECGKPNPRWASYSLGILICIHCSGIHRSLGTHISKVRSLDLDEWNDDQMRAIREIGNRKSKEFWEALLPANFHVTKENVEQFVHDKYVHKKFIKK